MAADLGHRGEAVGVEPKACVDRARARGEQLHRRCLVDRIGRTVAAQALQAQHLFAVQAQRLLAGGEHRHLRCCLE